MGVFFFHQWHNMNFFILFFELKPNFRCRVQKTTKTIFVLNAILKLHITPKIGLHTLIETKMPAFIWTTDRFLSNGSQAICLFWDDHLPPPLCTSFRYMLHF